MVSRCRGCGLGVCACRLKVKLMAVKAAQRRLLQLCAQERGVSTQTPMYVPGITLDLNVIRAYHVKARTRATMVEGKGIDVSAIMWLREGIQQVSCTPGLVLAQLFQRAALGGQGFVFISVPKLTS